MFQRTAFRWFSYREKKITDCYQLLITKKEVDYDFIAVDATTLVATALRLAKSVTTEQRRNKEVGRHVAQNLQQLLRKVRCRKSLLISLDGAEGLGKANISRTSVSTRRLESRLARLPGTTLMQAVEERLVKMMPQGPIFPKEVVIAGTCVAGSAEEKMSAWALDLACRDDFNGNTDSLCFIGASELFLHTMGMSPFYQVSNLVQHNADLRQLHLADLLEWMHLAKQAKDGDSATVARARTDVLFLYLLSHGCSSAELGATNGVSFVRLLDAYHAAVTENAGNVTTGGSTEVAPTGSSASCDPTVNGAGGGAAAGSRAIEDSTTKGATNLTHTFLFADAPGNRLELHVPMLCQLLRRAAVGERSTVAPSLHKWAESFFEHLLQTHASICLGHTPDSTFVPVSSDKEGGAASVANVTSITAGELLAHLLAWEASHGPRRHARALLPEKHEDTSRSPDTSETKSATPSVRAEAVCWSPCQPLTAAEYTVLSQALPANVEGTLHRYVGLPPKAELAKRIVQAPITEARALVQEVLSYANPDHPHRCLCLSPSYCWTQNDRTKLWRMAYVDLGERSRQLEIRRHRNHLIGLRMAHSAAREAPIVFDTSTSRWVAVPDFPCGGATHADKPPASLLKVLSWNVMFDRYSGQPTPLGMPGIDWCTPQRYPVLAKLIAEEAADVVGMQEVEPSFVEFLGAQPWCRASYIMSCSPTSPVVSPWGVLMLIHRRRWPITQLTHVNVPAWSGHMSLMPIVSLRLPSGPLHIAAAHLLAPYTKAHESARTAQDGALRQRVTKGVSGDCIVMGDFNDWPTNEFVMPPETQYRECWPLLHPNHPGKTMDDTNTFCKLKIEEIFFGRSDKVFVRSNRVEPAEAHLVGTRSVNEENGNTTAPAYLFPSDHYGVSMTFRFR